jgi:hypothetical protein
MEDIPREQSYVILRLECFKMFVSLIYLFMCYLFNDAIALEVRGGAIG